MLGNAQRRTFAHAVQETARVSQLCWKRGWSYPVNAPGQPQAPPTRCPPVNDTDRNWEIRVIGRSELRRAMAVIVAGQDASPDHVAREVDALETYSSLTSVSQTDHCGAFRGCELLAACLCFDHPGRTSLLFVPQLDTPSECDSMLLDLLEHQAEHAARRHIRLLQIILPPGRTHTEALLLRAAFQFLANLQYLECSVGRPGPPPVPEITWKTYNTKMRGAFVDTIERTYTGSLDCPLLSGKRDILDIVEGHKAAGHFDPHSWFLGLDRDQPLAVLLLSVSPGMNNAEIVYMGVVPEARGRGLGRALLHTANVAAVQARAECLTLAVDADNHYALRLYRSFGFACKVERRAWVRSLDADSLPPALE